MSNEKLIFIQIYGFYPTFGPKIHGFGLSCHMIYRGRKKAVLSPLKL